MAKGWFAIPLEAMF